jgi:hypothetical protein
MFRHLGDGNTEGDRLLFPPSRDDSLEKSGNLPDPDVLVQEIFEDLDAALGLVRELATGLVPGDQWR